MTSPPTRRLTSSASRDFPDAVGPTMAPPAPSDMCEPPYTKPIPHTEGRIVLHQIGGEAPSGSQPGQFAQRPRRIRPQFGGPVRIEGRKLVGGTVAQRTGDRGIEFGGTRVEIARCRVIVFGASIGHDEHRRAARLDQRSPGIGASAGPSGSI